uniref:Uncharacterized protein n=1 Tax=Arundo donax TaxID=35708 RepID=A0A0A9HBW6_ARUDO
MTKNRSGITPKAQKDEHTASRHSGTKVRSEARNTRDSSEIENEFASDEPTFHFNPKAKKLPTQATRQSQNIDLRPSVREMEPLTEARQRRNWSKPPYAERSNTPLWDNRRSVSLPRGKIPQV